MLTLHRCGSERRQTFVVSVWKVPVTDQSLELAHLLAELHRTIADYAHAQSKAQMLQDACPFWMTFDCVAAPSQDPTQHVKLSGGGTLGAAGDPAPSAKLLALHNGVSCTSEHGLWGYQRSQAGRTALEAVLNCRAHTTVPSRACTCNSIQIRDLV